MRVMCFVSSAGGCGKSFIINRLSRALAANGKKVLVSELSYGNRYLDLSFDVTDSVLYDLPDYLNGQLAFDDLITDAEENLSLICTSLERKEFDISKAVTKIIRESDDKYDYLLVDVCGNDVIEQLLATGIECEYTVICQPHMTEMRNCDALVSRMGNENAVNLIINRVSPIRIDKGYDMGIDEIIDTLHIPLLGVVYDFADGVDNKLNYISKEDEKLSEMIFDSISKRISGENIPITSYKKSNIVKKLFG